MIDGMQILTEHMMVFFLLPRLPSAPDVIGPTANDTTHPLKPPQFKPSIIMQPPPGSKVQRPVVPPSQAPPSASPAPESKTEGLHAYLDGLLASFFLPGDRPAGTPSFAMPTGTRAHAPT